MSALRTGAFWAAAAERAIKTVAQTALALLTADATGLFDVNWASIGSTAGLAGFVSILTSVASAGFGNVGPSLTSEVLTPPAPEIPADPEPPGI